MDKCFDVFDVDILDDDFSEYSTAFCLDPPDESVGAINWFYKFKSLD